MLASGLMVWASVVSTGALTQQARACGGDPVPTCGTTYVLSTGGGFTVITTPTIGGVVDIETVHFFDMVEIPPGSGVCPLPGFSLTITVTGVCPLGGSPAPVVVGPMPIGPGFTTVPVSVPFPPGPQRECTLLVTGTVTLSNGSTLSQTRPLGVCLVRPAPGNPSVARLALDPIGPTFNTTHPGDQTSNIYRLTNNDPVRTWTGTFDASMVNVATRPLGPADSAFAVSDPGTGDNYPMMFADELAPGGCIPLPANPHAHVSALSRDITLAPGESRELEIVVRPWGMCANGSCGEKTVKVEGLFSDGSRGFACAGATVAAATSTVPTYAWPDAGRVIEFMPGTPFPPEIIVIGFPDPTPTPRGGRLVIDPTSQQVFVGPDRLPANFVTQPLPIDPLASNPEAGRFESNVQFPPITPNSFFDVFVDISLAPSNPNTGPILLQNMDVVPDAPSGIADRAPIAMGVATVAGNGVPDSFFDIFYQISVDGRRPSGAISPMRIEQLELTPLGPGNRLRVHAGVHAFDPGSEPFTGLRVRQDFRGFARLGNAVPPCNPDLNQDGVVDQGDVDYLIDVIAGGPNPTGIDPDFNGDGNVDQGDVDALIDVVAGGDCP